MNEWLIGKAAVLLGVIGVIMGLGSMGPILAQQEGDNWMELHMNNEQWQSAGGLAQSTGDRRGQ